MGNNSKILHLADLLERQILDFAYTDGRIMEEIGVSNGTFYKLKPKALEEVNRRSQVRQSAIDATLTHEASQGAKNGLKSKTDRVMLLQNQVDELLADLKTKLRPTEKAYLRKTLKEIQAEISKIEGDYAPEKRALTDEEGKGIDWSKLSTNVLKEILAAGE